MSATDSFTMPTLSDAAAKPQKPTVRAEASVVTIEGRALTIPYVVKLPGGDRRDAEAAQPIIDAVWAMAERAFSPFNAESDLCRLNAATPGVRVAVSREFITVMRLCAALHQWSLGAFDPVAAASQMKRTWAGSISLEEKQGTASRAFDDVKLDLSAVSKGWCVDTLAERLAREVAGVEPVDSTTGLPTARPGVYVDWGGDIRAVGCHPSGRAWVCALPVHPSLAGTKAAAGAKGATSIELVSAAACTSGSYAAMRRGSTVATGMDHLVNTAASSSSTVADSSAVGGDDTLIAVTVVHSSCAVADALATVLASRRTVGSAVAALKASHAADPQALQAVAALGSAMPRSSLHLFRALAEVTPTAAVQELLPLCGLEHKPPTMAAPAAMSLKEELSTAMRGRVLNHVALVTAIPGDAEGRYFAAAVTSFQPLLKLSMKSGSPALVPGTIVAAVAVLAQSRMLQLVQPSTTAATAEGVRVHVIAARGAYEQQQVAFLEHCRAGSVLSQRDGEATIATLGTASATPLRWSLTRPPIVVGDHAIAFIETASHQQQPTAAAAVPSPISSPPVPLVTRRGNAPLHIPLPTAVAAAASADRRLPLVAHRALVTAWIPEARGMLATTVRSAEFTSRDPPLITFTVKAPAGSTVDRRVFAAGSAHHRLHLLDGDAKGGGGGQEETLIDWFDDGANADPSLQFMYVTGAATEGAAARFTFDGCCRGQYAVVSFTVAELHAPVGADDKSAYSIIVGAPQRVDNVRLPLAVPTPLVASKLLQCGIL
jgi:thiamine biosynthesis lipoprotein